MTGSLLQQGLARHYSGEQLRRLATVRVGIAGAGGLGSNCAMLLARNGVRHLVIVDFDQVEPSNLNRQCYFAADVGRAKVAALGRHLHSLDPDLDLSLVEARLEPSSLASIFAGCGIVVEALDSPKAKAMLCNHFARPDSGVFLACASGLGGFGGPPMGMRRLGPNMVCVGDFVTEADNHNPPLGPRVMQAAAMQADAVLGHILSDSGAAKKAGGIP